LNDAPTSGPVEPRVHRASKVSGENSPIRVTSLTSAHTCAGGASMCSDTSPVIGRKMPIMKRSQRPTVELVETTAAKAPSCGPAGAQGADISTGSMTGGRLERQARS
jgi:hypothetical protein